MLRNVTIVVAALLIAVAPRAHAQFTRPQFEVASIKPSPFTGQGRVGIAVVGNRLLAQHSSLVDLIAFAYDVLEDYQISGGPLWLYSRDLYSSDVYDVSATAGEGPVPTQQQFRNMLQALLTERFRLSLHHETRDLQAYALVIGPKGSKLMEVAPDPKGQFASWKSGGLESQYDAQSVSMASLVFVLRMVTRRPVLDKTGLDGTYKFNLRYTGADPPDPTSTAPSIFTAVQEQLGLKLESGKQPFDVLVIDGVERPTQN